MEMGFKANFIHSAELLYQPFPFHHQLSWHQLGLIYFGYFFGYFFWEKVLCQILCARYLGVTAAFPIQHLFSFFFCSVYLHICLFVCFWSSSKDIFFVGLFQREAKGGRREEQRNINVRKIHWLVASRTWQRDEPATEVNDLGRESSTWPFRLWVNPLTT